MDARRSLLPRVGFGIGTGDVDLSVLAGSGGGFEKGCSTLPATGFDDGIEDADLSILRGRGGGIGTEDVGCASTDS